jgi:hypothetical protein
MALLKYASALKEIHKALLIEASKTSLAGLESTWAITISDWIAELDSMNADREAILRHVQRTRYAFGGMGSLNDIASTDGTSLDRDRETLFKLCNKLISQYQ